MAAAEAHNAFFVLLRDAGPSAELPSPAGTGKVAGWGQGGGETFGEAAGKGASGSDPSMHLILFLSF